MGFEKRYNSGDIVEIVSPDIYRSRGGSCTPQCAIAEFCGSICEVIGQVDSRVALTPLKVQQNFITDRHRSIEEFSWSPMSLVRHTGAVDLALAEELDAVFN